MLGYVTNVGFEAMVFTQFLGHDKMLDSVILPISFDNALITQETRRFNREGSTIRNPEVYIHGRFHSRSLRVRIDSHSVYISGSQRLRCAAIAVI